MNKNVNTQKLDKKNINTKNKDKKIVIKDKYKFVTFVLVTLILLVGLIVMIFLNAKVKIDSDTNFSKLNANKYKKEIKQEYEKEGRDSEFLNDWNKVQDAVGTYFIENYSTEEAENLVADINNVLSSDDWSKINCTKPKMWNGTWSINESANVTFKFANKEVEPISWAQALSESGYITLN